jgi:hypothetical protein
MRVSGSTHDHFGAHEAPELPSDRAARWNHRLRERKLGNSRYPGLERRHADARLARVVGYDRRQEIRGLDPRPVDRPEEILVLLGLATRDRLKESATAQTLDRLRHAAAVLKGGKRLLAKIIRRMVVGWNVDLESRRNRSRRFVHYLDQQAKRIVVHLEAERLAQRDSVRARLERNRRAILTHHFENPILEIVDAELPEWSRQGDLPSFEPRHEVDFGGCGVRGLAKPLDFPAQNARAAVRQYSGVQFVFDRDAPLCDFDPFRLFYSRLGLPRWRGNRSLVYRWLGIFIN